MELPLALTPQTNDAFLREVDEELRRDQALDFWQRYGRWVIAAIVGGLAIFAGVLYWQQRQEQRSGEQGQQFGALFESLGSGDQKKAIAPLADLAANGAPGYRASAKFVQADLALQKNDLKSAAAKFADVAADTSLAQPFRDLALIRQTSAEYDGLKPETVIARLSPLAVKGGPWFASAGEMVAIAHLRLKHPAQAGKLFGEIAGDPNVPETARQRAVQMAGALGVDAVKQVEEKKAQ